MKLLQVTDNSIEFDDGTIIQDYHSQDCCETVYADFSVLKDRIGEDFPSIAIKEVPNSGFRIGTEFVPCYDIQNGYYSSNLELIIKRPDMTEIRLDITECVKSQEY